MTAMVKAATSSDPTNPQMITGRHGMLWGDKSMLLVR